MSAETYGNLLAWICLLFGRPPLLPSATPIHEGAVSFWRRSSDRYRALRPGAYFAVNKAAFGSPSLKGKGLKEPGRSASRLRHPVSLCRLFPREGTALHPF